MCWEDASERRTLVTKTLTELWHCGGYVERKHNRLKTPIEDPEAFYFRKHAFH